MDTTAKTSPPFDPDRYGVILAGLLLPPRLMPLDAGAPNLAVRPLLQSLDLAQAFAPHRIHDPAMARACHAGLWLYHNFLDESHRISQDLATPTGSFWHGILHRREPDAANASYWFRRVGEHPIFSVLAQEARELGLRLHSDRWDPFEFIDLCEQHRDTETEMEMLLRHMQQREWERLFAWCYTQSVEPG